MYIGKGGTLNNVNLNGFLLIKQVISVFGCVLAELIKQRVEIGQMQCMCMSGHGDTTDRIFILSQL